MISLSPRRRVEVSNRGKGISVSGTTKTRRQTRHHSKHTGAPRVRAPHYSTMAPIHQDVLIVGAGISGVGGEFGAPACPGDGPPPPAAADARPFLFLASFASSASPSFPWCCAPQKPATTSTRLARNSATPSSRSRAPLAAPGRESRHAMGIALCLRTAFGGRALRQRPSPGPSPEIRITHLALASRRLASRKCPRNCEIRHL